MENIDLKTMWQKANIQSYGNISKEANIERIIKMNHCKTIAQVLSDIKMKIFLFTMLLFVFISLMIYALVYLGIRLSVNSVMPFSLVGLFLLISTTMEINRLLVFKRNSDNLTVKESINNFRKKLNRTKMIDFFSSLILLYLLAILIIRGYIHDIGGFKNLSATNEFQPLIMILIVILLLTPWFIKYQNNQRYKKIYSDLNDSTDILNDDH